MAGERAALVATDSPYFVGYAAAPTHKPGKERRESLRQGLVMGRLHRSRRARWLYSSSLAAASRKPSPTALALPVVRHDARRLVLEARRANGLLAPPDLIWEKSRSVLTHCDFMWNYEPCLYGWLEGQAAGSRAAPAGGCCSGLGGRLGHRGRRRRPAPDDEAGGVVAGLSSGTRCRASCLRAVQRLRHGDHRRRDDRPALLCHGALAGIRRLRSGTMAGLHRPDGRARTGQRR